ncbi:cytochrome ubiquinol oxidase subunit I, partial [Nocardia seriolae]
MTAVAPKPEQNLDFARPFPARRGLKGSFIYKAITTTDPKMLGMMYLTTAITYFLIGGIMALLMRAELARPGMQFLSPEQFNQLFTMHGTIMLLF